MRKVTVWPNGNKKSERYYLGGFEVFREYAATKSASLERETLHVVEDKQRLALIETQTIDGGAVGQRAGPGSIRYQLANHLGSPVWS